MSVESGILHHSKEHKRADETFNQHTRDLFDKYLHGHTRCQPLNRTECVSVCRVEAEPNRIRAKNSSRDTL